MRTIREILEPFILDNKQHLYSYNAEFLIRQLEENRIAFAKLHAKAALKAASENVMQYGENVSRIPVYNVDKESILNAYSETLIK